MATKTTDFFGELSAAAAGGIVADNSPVGTVSDQVGWVDPKWLACDGSVVDGNQYPALRDVLVAAGLPGEIGIPDFSTGGGVVSGTPTLAGSGFGCAFSPDGSLLAVAHFNSPFLTVINTSDWSVVSGTPTLPDTGYDCAFNPNGDLIGTAHIWAPHATVISADTVPIGVQLPSHLPAARLVAEIPIKIKALP